MFGQGRPRPPSRAPIALSRRAALWIRNSALVLLFIVGAIDCALGEEITLRLRIAWGGGPERTWHGSLALDEGEFADLQTLGVEADEPGSVWLAAKNRVQFRQPTQRSYDGLDVTVRGESEARLVIELSGDGQQQPRRVDLSLGELVSGSHGSDLDAEGNRLSVARAPGDRLRVDFEREHLVFAPGEEFQLEARPHLIGASTAGLRLSAQVSGSGGARVWAKEYAIGEDGSAVGIALPVPKTEGVYDLTLAVAPASRLKQKLGLQRPVVERKVQFVVISPEATPQAGEAPTAKVVEINPMNSRWWERFANLQLIPGYRQGPLGSGDAATWNHPALGSLVQLGPRGTPPEISWEAYPLPIAHPGQAHVLEVEYPSDVPQSMGISLIEPNAAGAVMPIGLDSGVYVADEDATDAPRLLRHRVVFWPKTKTPLVLITNRREGARAVYGKIAVYSAPQSQLAALAFGRFDSGSALPPAFAENPGGERLWAGYMDRPLVPENLGAPEALDAASGRSLDDWVTFHEGGTRLVKYLKHVGYNGLMLSVLADGSTLYPSRVVAPTPRYDTGIFFSTGQDPKRKDALELLFRLFDREQLVLIPAMQFAAPLPEIEALLRAGGPQSVGLEWIDANGRVKAASDAGPSANYNLLDPRVQQAMLRAVSEVIDRYAGHPSFGGLALQLSPETYAQLPAGPGGFDDATVARFEKAMATKVPGAGQQRFVARANYFAGGGREAWLAWRSSVVGDFHRRIEQLVASRHEGAKLYIAGGAMLEDPRLRLRPSLPRRLKLDDALEEIGLSVPSYVQSPGIVLLKPQLVRPATADALAAGSESEVYLSSELDRLFGSQAQRGTLFYHEPQKARLPGFDIKSPFGAANTYTWLVAQMSPSGDRNRRRFIHSLATSDSAEMFDGGWLLPMGQEESLRGALAVYRELPQGPFRTVNGDLQPLVVRMLSREGETFVYIVNDSPWTVDAAVQLDVPQACELERLGDASENVTLAGGRGSWPLKLKPYDLIAARLPLDKVRITNVSVKLPPDVAEVLGQRIADLVARVRTLGQPLVENAGFESPLAERQLVGWSASIPAGGRVALDSRTKRSGEQSLLLSGTERVSVASAPFEPRSGRLSVDVWLRTSGKGPPPAVRIAVEGKWRDADFRPHGVIEQVGQTAANPGDWVLYSFPVEQLPTSELSPLRVRFELVRGGEVWIDDVQVRAFNDSELIELSKLNALASMHLEKRQYADCARLLEGYWPQFLVANVPLANTPIAQRPKLPEPPPVEEPAKKPSLFESMRGLVPQWR